MDQSSNKPSNKLSNQSSSQKSKKPVDKISADMDQLFIKAENLSKDFSYRDAERVDLSEFIDGLLPSQTIEKNLKRIKKLDVDNYVERTVLPAEDPGRPNAKAVIKSFNGKVFQEISNGPFYAAEIEIDFGESFRRVGIIAQNRAESNGAWMPEHHLAACAAVTKFAELSLPVVMLIDTPGADAGEVANANNQAHTISRLIAETANLDVPTVGVIIGIAYSGGAIPLASANVLLSVRDGIFNAIQPKGLVNIARKYNLSWQECAKSVGVSPEELFKQGCIDGIVDYSPTDKGDKQQNLRKAIVSSIQYIESNAREFVKTNPYILEYYAHSIQRYLEPSDNLRRVEEASNLYLANSPTASFNVFGITYRYLRYFTIRKRIHSISVENYGRLAEQEIPKGDLAKRLDEDRRLKFKLWLNDPDKVIYADELFKSWKNFLSKRDTVEDERGAIARFILGEPKENYEKAKTDLFFHLSTYLYNRWKTDGQSNFHSLIQYLEDTESFPSKSVFPENKKITILDIILHEELRYGFIIECQNILIFDYIYDDVTGNLVSISKEANETKSISRESVGTLLEKGLQTAISFFEKSRRKTDKQKAFNQKQLSNQFNDWLKYFTGHSNSGALLSTVEEWKSIGYPQLSDTLFVIITFFFEQLLSEYYRTTEDSSRYKGVISPARIGRRKDFWNRLTMAYHDLLIQQVLKTEKKKGKTTAEAFLGRYIENFSELNGNIISANPVDFPGFRFSIEEALDKGVIPCGVITGVGDFKLNGEKRRVGLLISNVIFQAGSFDMASAEKFCKLLVECAAQKLPVVCFVSSGGMQTKEGAAALFSMAVVNDRITRFVRDMELPIIMFGFGDCTGGAQASFVTHPLVQTYYFSGTNMPFAGQMVVPSYLPSTSTLSNYLSQTPGSMQGLVVNPFAENIDEELKAIDGFIPTPKQTVEDILERALEGFIAGESLEPVTGETDHRELMKPVQKTLIHARGCTAIKLIRVAQRKGIKCVLVASDPDMTSVPVDMLGEGDQLVCIGGNTSDESYLNAMSVLRIAEYEGVDSLHPGIGFLAENAQFAGLCVNHKINFIGPSVYSMQTMGNKSNAINTALKLNLPVVPGSHGILTSADKAASVALEIGYPVLIKAVHGGGGKGIQVVEHPENIHEYFHQVSAEAKSAFGNGDIYLEKYITSLRHIEIQLLRDQFGHTKVLGLRDCSVQRNNQKVFEESASTMLPEKLKQDAMKYAEALANEVDYIGAGTVEFIYDLDSNAIFFMEMNTRLQVEHPVTEKVSGVDIVGAQFDIASGSSIENIQPVEKGYAIEVRVTAEKVVLDKDDIPQIVPTPGLITECIMPEQENMEIISMAASNKIVSPFYDSLIAQIICYGEGRADTISKLLTYLESVSIKGICTNIPLLKCVLKDEIFNRGDYDTTYLPKLLARIDKHALIDEIETAAGKSDNIVDLDSLKIEGTEEIKVVANSTGIFYTSPSPAEPDFVKVGDVVSTDQTLCLLEAMKMFSPVSLNSSNKKDSVIYASDRKYVIERINNASGQQVSTGDLLFVVSPLEA